MRGMNKKGFEISINMIIIVILAIVTLFVALGFITGFLPEIFNQFPEFPTVDVATSDDPIKLNPSTMERGKRTGLSVSFYNNEMEDVTSDDKPVISCEGIAGLVADASGLNIPVGEANTYQIIVTMPKNTPSGPYSCTITISDTQKTFILEVK